MLSGRLCRTGAEYCGFALFLIVLLRILVVLLAPYYKVFHDPCSMMSTAQLFFVDVVGPASAQVCRTVENFPQVDDLSFINP